MLRIISGSLRVPVKGKASGRFTDVMVLENDMRILVTGAAGFIGAALSERLAKRGDDVLGIDNMSPYYDVRLKEARLNRLKPFPKFHFEKLDLCDAGKMLDAFSRFKPQRVVNLAAQAGVRNSISNPAAYTQSNLVGFANVLECCRHNHVEHLVYASSSSVYGANSKLPFSTDDPIDHPVSYYAATKKANEVMAHSYSHLYQLPTTGLRFFTVYGPWGRPDMSFFLFTKAILAGQAIHLFNKGEHRRDFTYIDDIVEGVTRVLDKAPTPNKDWDTLHPIPSKSSAPFRIYNIGNNSPVWLMDMVTTLERALGMEAKKVFEPMAMGDVEATYADVQSLKEDFGFNPKTTLEEGTKKFVEWYRSYYSNRPSRAPRMESELREDLS